MGHFIKSRGTKRAGWWWWWWVWIFAFPLTIQLSSQGSIIILEDVTADCPPCYRKLLAGKKILEVHVRRAVECGRIDDCHRACDYEKVFNCEGFNYRRMGAGARGMCELTSVPYSRTDLHRDFASDPQCDYYERETTCDPPLSEYRPSWSSSPSRPDQSYGPPRSRYPINGRPPTGDLGPYIPNRRPTNDHLPRPPDYDRRPPNYDESRFDELTPQYGPPIDSYFPKDHSRPYPPRRPDEGSSYRTPHDTYNGNFLYGRAPSYLPVFPNRRMHYGPHHDIGTNEIPPYVPHRRNNSPNSNTWGTYDGVYGGSYGYDTNYVRPFDAPKHFPKRPAEEKPPRPYENHHFYGQFYNYGGAFGYGENLIPANEDRVYGGNEGSRDCSIRASAGFKLSRGVVQKTYLTPNLNQCESLCISDKSFLCASFAYRYNVASTDPTDNCLHSDVSYKDLNFYTDLEPDRNYDIYAMSADPKACSTKKPISSPHPPDECFWRVRSGFGMPPDVTRKSMLVDGLGDCQAQCTISQRFTCRSFAFRYGQRDPAQEDSTNCYLSDWPSQEINPINMPDMDGAELYERGSFGRGCEPYPLPPFNLGRFDEKPRQRDEICYSGYHRPCRLTAYAVLLSTRVESEAGCREKCSKMRELNTIPCLSFSYKIVTDDRDDNCLLSDVPIRDLRPGLDYTYDDDHVLYAWRDLDPLCVANYQNDHDHGYGTPNLSGPQRPTDLGQTPHNPERPGIFIADPGPPYGQEGALRPPDDGYYYRPRPYDPDRPDPVNPSYGSDFGHDYKYSPGGQRFIGTYGTALNFLFPPKDSPFKHYTVNGYPCKSGTNCERNKVANFWSCETEGSEFGTWDYCCVPDHHCGYSQGYDYPWCYVGPSEDQWRPCSDKYYPYLPSPRPIRPQIGVHYRHHYHEEGHRPLDPHETGYAARHWPITYLHGEPPPNCTDSLASADDNKDRRRINASAQGTVQIIDKLPNNRSLEKENHHARRRRFRSRAVIADRLDVESPKWQDQRNIVKDGDNSDTIFSRRIEARFVSTSATNTDRHGRIERVFKSYNPRELSGVVHTKWSTVAVPTLIAAANDTDHRSAKTIVSSNESYVKSPRGWLRVPLTSLNNSNITNSTLHSTKLTY